MRAFEQFIADGHDFLGNRLQESGAPFGRDFPVGIECRPGGSTDLVYLLDRGDGKLGRDLLAARCGICPESLRIDLVHDRSTYKVRQ